jgi:5-(carboxyamino)imidazole ribonucleotide mutase
MPGGVPVATVAINGAKNAGILAAQILGTSDPKIQQKVVDFKGDMQAVVEARAAKMEGDSGS